MRYSTYSIRNGKKNKENEQDFIFTGLKKIEEDRNNYFTPYPGLLSA
jgi:hypothetical protein